MSAVLKIDLDNEKIEKIREFRKGETIDVCFSSFNTSIEKIEQTIRQFNELKKCKVGKVFWDAKFEEKYIDGADKIEALKAIDEFCQKENIEFNIILNAKISTIEKNSFKNVVLAENMIEDLKNKIEAMTINKRKLTTAEKFFCVYDFVANRIYKKNDNFEDNRMRSWIGVLTGTDVICSGFAETLKCVCDRVFDKNELFCAVQICQVGSKATGEEYGWHANNIVFIKDDAYKLNGLYLCDPCWDCALDDRPGTNTFNFFLIPTQKVKKDKSTYFNFSDSPDLFYGYDVSPRDEDVGMYVDGEDDNMIRYLTHKHGKSSLREIVSEAEQIKIKKFNEMPRKVKRKTDMVIENMLVEELKRKVGISMDDLYMSTYELLTSEWVDEKLFKNGLKAVAELRGITNKIEAKKWINEEMRFFHHRQKAHFDIEEKEL